MYSNIQKIMDEGFTFNIPSSMELEKLGLDENISVILSPGSNLASARENAEYEQFLADVWVGIVLTLMVLVCVCCMCSCLLYHKFQQWKRSVMAARTPSNAETGNAGCAEAELPSYSIASGLPSYEEALEQLQKVKELINTGENSEKNFRTTQHGSNWVPRTPPTPVHISVTTLFHNYRRTNSNSNLEVEAKPT